MSKPKPLEERLLTPARRVLDLAGFTPEARLDILEAAASRLGGFKLTEYRKRFDASHTLSEPHALDSAEKLLNILKTGPIPLSLALSALARPQISQSEQRTSGAYYTDFRLAQYVAASAAPHLVQGARVIDPAAGTGILLVAASLVASGLDRLRRATWLAESVTAWDLSSEALRGARLALASLTDDLAAIEAMVSSWRCHDSLLVRDAPWGEFDVVLGNPPWEKTRLTRHEFVKANGGARHYGDDYGNGSLDDDLFAFKRNEVTQYGNTLAIRYPLLGRGEPDLYKAFLELILKLVRPHGCVSTLVPAGLIRSQGTEDLRRFLVTNTYELSFTVMENRARFFAIDTRFKFLGLVLSKGTADVGRPYLQVLHAEGTDTGVSVTGRARIERKALEDIRPNLTVPEVRSEDEWRLFRKMSEHSVSGTSERAGWESDIVREVDMTRDRMHFSRSSGVDKLVLVEGRMVHHHRFGAKAYRSGTGRRAKWDTVPLGAQWVMPQFWFPAGRLSNSVRERADRVRAGFCDITGQTNERSMLAALIPSGVVCGNKVPTVTFRNDSSEDRLFLWLAIVNSFPFDWALRRIVTTTVNYFVLNSVPFPKVRLDSPFGQRLVEAARELHRLGNEEAGSDPLSVAALRAEIDVAVSALYGLGFSELELILRDFPLLDRGQPAIGREERSTITRDFLLVEAAERLKGHPGAYGRRLQAALAIGAVPYVPSEFSLTEVTPEAEIGDV